jgi:tetratricopeptide (TPR) repeat protein
MSANGPFDQPDFCLEQGRVFARSGLYRQAAQQFDRTVALAPENVPARLLLSQLYLVSQVPDRALSLINEIRALPPAISLARSNQTELLYLEMSLHLAKGEIPAAEAAFSDTITRFPGDEELLGTATRVFIKAGYFTNAIGVLDRQLQVTPDNVGALVNKAYTYMQFHDYGQAVVSLNKAISWSPPTAPLCSIAPSVICSSTTWRSATQL